MTIEEIIDDTLISNATTLLAALEFGAPTSRMRRVIPLGAA